MITLWLFGDGTREGITLIFLLGIMALARWRFDLPAWTTLIDQAACLLFIPLWPEAWLGLALPLFEIALAGQLWLILPTIAACIGYAKLDVTLYFIYFQSLVLGKITSSWQTGIHHYREEADQERRDRYELEMLKGELLAANVQIAQLAELKERSRISQKLHDDVGHELTAALLAFQAFEQLWKEQDDGATEMFEQALQRLRNSSQELRETVHNMKPVHVSEISGIEDICLNFNAIPVQLHIYGDTSEVAVYLWMILRSCLKEALTNAVRHSQASRVEVSLDVSDSIVRLSVENDGVITSSDESGIGLRNLRQRAHSVGGTISTNTNHGFQLVCVLPIRKEGIR
ncbi:two-component sensor histidine kinase [Paenibacillus sp. JCM 10914]|nr:two-component sensor histidine kinase [Paenibacillus sp. JCM 10914]